MWAWVTFWPGIFEPEGRTSVNVQKLDIDLCDEDGNVCVKMQGFSSRMLERKISEEPEGIRTLMVKPVWKKKSVDPIQKLTEHTEHCVFLGGLSQTSRQLQDKMPHILFKDLLSDQEPLEKCF